MAGTKEDIINGFLELAKEKRPDKITVIDICKKAHIARETFYYHFEDKYDLFKWMYRQNLTERIRSHFGEGSWQEIIEKAINDAVEYHITFEKILGKAPLEYSEIVFETLYNFYYEELSKGLPDGKLSEQTEAEMYIYLRGGIDYFKFYFEKHKDASYKDVSKLIAGAMPETLTKLYDEKEK